MLTDWVLTRFSSALNHYLRSDPTSFARLAKLKGKTIAITLLPREKPFYLHFHADGVSLQTESAIDPVTSIAGTPLRLLATGLSPQDRKQFFADDVQLSGDAEFAQSVIELFDQIHFDWEEQASKWLGDITAHKLGNVFRQIHTHWQASCNSLNAQVSEYLQEEATWLPERTRIANFLLEVDELRMATDRLEAKINYLLASKKDTE